jgi:hypothetical protein
MIAGAVAVISVAVPGAAFAAGSGKGGQACRKGRWCSLRSERYRYEVWTRGTSNTGADTRILARTVGLLDSIWGPETKLMGDPLPDVSRSGGKRDARDTGNDSSRLDVYVVTPAQDVSRDGFQEQIGGPNAVAVSIPTPSSAAHRPPKSESAYILLGRGRFGAKGFKSDVVHEFFHVLQFAHNVKASYDCPRAADSASFWFNEASATWAETYFDPADAKDEVFYRFSTFQSGDSWGLGDVANGHAYESFIWPYFMQQESGAKAIAEVYKRAEGAKNCHQLMEAVNQTFPFQSHFHDFAVRNLNNSDRFSGGSLSPVTPRYQSLHSDFPDGAKDFLDTPTIANSRSLVSQPSDQPPLKETLNVPSLRAWYYEYDVDPGVGQVVVDPASVSPRGVFNVDAVVGHDDGTWEVRHLGSSKGKICNDARDITKIELVVSNHGWDPAKNLTGNLEVSPLVPGCACPDFTKVKSFDGNANFSFERTATTTSGGDTETVTLKHHASGLALRAPVNSSDVQHAAFDGPISTGSIDVHDVDDDSNLPSHTTQDASGSPDPNNSQVAITFDPGSCTYTISVNGSIATSYAGDGPPSSDGGINDAATSPVTRIPAGLNLSGSVTIQTYLGSGPTDLAQLAAGYYAFGPFSGWGGELGQVLGVEFNQSMGSASFSWNLTPTFNSTPHR